MRVQFVHLPKCGGRSIERILIERFKQNYLRLNGNHLTYLKGNNNKAKYRNQAIKAMVWSLKREMCVYGHFPIFKYPSLSSRYVFVRHPVSRVISEFNFFKAKNPENLVGIDLEEYIMRYNYVSLYSYAFSDIEPSKLNYIGIFEEFDESVKRLGEILGLDSCAIPHENKTTYTETIDPARYKELESHFSEDLAIYSRLREEFERRLL